MNSEEFAGRLRDIGRVGITAADAAEAFRVASRALAAAPRLPDFFLSPEALADIRDWGLGAAPPLGPATRLGARTGIAPRRTTPAAPAAGRTRIRFS